MPETVLAGRELGLDIDDHLARPLAPYQVDRADLVLGMAREHTDEIVALVPEARPKTFALKELVLLLDGLPPAAWPPDRNRLLSRVGEAHRLREEAPPGPPAGLDVRDPIGMGLNAYRDVALDIETEVDRMVRGLFGVPAPAEAAAGERT